MNKRERKREAHWIVARLIQNYMTLDRDEDCNLYDTELREILTEHERKGWKEEADCRSR